MIPVSVALIGTLPMEPRSEVRVGSALPSNNGYRTRAHLNWVVPPQLASEIKKIALPEITTSPFQKQILKLAFKTFQHLNSVFKFLRKSLEHKP